MRAVNPKISIIIALLSFTIVPGMLPPAYGDVVREGEKTYIVDREGYRWDVTQAESLGFTPEKFQYGIGKDTIVPLNGSHLEENDGSSYFNFRVIGIADNGESHAYSVSTLTQREIVNSDLSGKAIAVGY